VPHTRPVSAIVDFADEVDSLPVRRRFVSPVRELRADALGEVIPTLDEADRLARSGLWLVGFVSYDASPAFDAAYSSHRDERVPLAWFAAFDRPESVVAGDYDARAARADDRAHSLMPVSAVADREHHAGVRRVRDYIAAGDVYQVNLTVPFTSPSALSPAALYERLLAAQRGRYSAHLDFGDLQIMSASPELFFERRGSTVRSRPMKGTAARGLSSAADGVVRRALEHSEKERAENVMIVDVARNDIGRIARAGTVRVSALCEAERYPRVWQLTSTIEGEVDAALPLSRVFEALFPPASITGAPKIRAASIVRELEHSPRAVYCGAIGMIRPGGDATFNVAIRTAWSADGGRTVRLDTGGGITTDSTAAGELAELRTKLTAFTVPALRPTLFETIRMEHGRPVRLDRHLARMAASADYFALPFDAARATEAVNGAGAELRHAPVARCRLTLAPNDFPTASAQPFDDPLAGSAPRSVALCQEPVHRGDLRLYHKTTDRAPYERALAAAGTVFDVLLWNEAYEATELSRGNLVAEIDGARWTPSLQCGLLGGTLRAELLESGTIRERVLTLDEVTAAERLWFINSLRGWVPITLRA
jgi:para-aminobenzoate synthetase/4-amino-4-deoxychorismate lyase